MASRQREWQKKRVAAGKCQTCGKLRDSGDATYCEVCRVKKQKIDSARAKRKKSEEKK